MLRNESEIIVLPNLTIYKKHKSTVCGIVWIIQKQTISTGGQSYASNNNRIKQKYN